MGGKEKEDMEFKEWLETNFGERIVRDEKKIEKLKEQEYDEEVAINTFDIDEVYSKYYGAQGAAKKGSKTTFRKKLVKVGYPIYEGDYHIGIKEYLYAEFEKYMGSQMIKTGDDRDMVEKKQIVASCMNDISAYEKVSYEIYIEQFFETKGDIVGYKIKEPIDEKRGFVNADLMLVFMIQRREQGYKIKNLEQDYKSWHIENLWETLPTNKEIKGFIANYLKQNQNYVKKKTWIQK